MTTTKPTHKPKVITIPGLVVLQWLSYVSWGLTITALTTVIALVVEYTINSPGWVDPSSVLYAFAALAILLPLAVVLDTIFSRYESSQKNIALSVVMVIHVVLYVLIAVGSLITLLFAGITQLTSVSATNNTVTIVSSGLLALLFSGLVLRIIRPLHWKWLRTAYRLKMVGLTLIAAVFAISGPITYSVTTRDDRAVRDSAQYVSGLLNNYVSQRKELPKDITTALNDSESYYGEPDLKSTVQRVVSEKKLTYKPNTQQPETSNDNNQNSTIYFYELCATYTHALKNGNSSGPNYGPSSVTNSSYPEYKDYLNNDAVQPGTTCYKLKAVGYK